MKSKLLTLIVVLLILDVIWINNVMSERYSQIFNNLLIGNIELNYIYAFITYCIMVLALYYFVLRESKDANNALFRGALMGFIMYGVYDGTLYSFLPIKDYQTGLLDVAWGTFVCGFSSYIAFRYGKNL